MAWPDEDLPALETIFPEVDQLGAAPLYCQVIEGLLHVSIRVPPGLAPGRHEARLKVGSAAWSESLEFLLDLPAWEQPVRILSVQDGITWSFDEIDWVNGGWMTLWVEGLSAEVDPGNVTVYVDGIPHDVYSVVPQTGQVNAKLRPLVDAGTSEVRVEHRGVRSEAVGVRIAGAAPPIRGLEQL